MSAALLGIGACVFDAYGTLFDFHAPVAKLASRIGEKADQLSKQWRQKQIEYTWLRSLMGTHADFWSVTDDALSYVLDSHGIEDNELKKELMELYLHVGVYPDVLQCLASLKRIGMRTAILSMELR